MAAGQENDNILYQPDESPPPMACLVHGFQSIMGRMASLAASTAIIVQASGEPDSYLVWVYFVSLVVCGVGTIAQTFQVWRFGSGYPVMVTNGSAYIAVCISALAAGGPTMLACLVIVSALIQFVLVSRLSLLRRFLTPLVTGTVLMLLAATVVMVLFDKLAHTPEDVPMMGPVAIAGTAFGVMLLFRLGLFVPSSWRQWGPIVGILAGCAVAAAMGMFDVKPFLDAPLIGLPLDGWPGFDVNLSPEFWGLLPGFVIVHLAVAVSSISGIMVVQQIAWRRPRATDFRVIQGALNLSGLTNILAAALGGLPNSITRGNAGRISLTGVAARKVGIYGGALMIGIAFLPKFIALVIAIPPWALGAYLIVNLSVLFVQSLQMVVSDGLDGRKSLALGVAFWLGLGFQNQMIFPELIDGVWASLLGNGLTIGSVTVIALTLLLEVTGPRSRRLRVDFDEKSLPEIDEFLSGYAAKQGWNEASVDRLRSAGEEALLSMLHVDEEEDPADDRKSLTVIARRDGRKIELEFVAASEGENLEDRLAYLDEQPEIQDDREISFRLLRHYASSVEHHKYHNIDVVTIEVEGSR